jgi:hypothetical protein
VAETSSDYASTVGAVTTEYVRMPAELTILVQSTAFSLSFTNGVIIEPGLDIGTTIQQFWDQNFHIKAMQHCPPKFKPYTKKSIKNIFLEILIDPKEVRLPF